MSQPTSERTRSIVAGSLPLVRSHTDEIMSQMEAHLRGIGGSDERFGQSEVAAMLLTQLLIDQAAAIAEQGSPRIPLGLAAEHRALDIVGRHYSRFGDALVPVLKDVLGSGVPSDLTAAWGDAFWLAVRAIQPQPELQPAA